MPVTGLVEFTTLTCPYLYVAAVPLIIYKDITELQIFFTFD